jgi:CheY-like chemotaxis protein
MSVPYKLCLLIDDNYIDSFVTRRILESVNFADEIVVRQSPAEAIDSLKSGEIKPNVIFVDVRMALMDGFKFIQEYDKLDEENKSAEKIFMLSSSLDPSDFKRSAENKYITQFLHKPLTHKTLEDLKV